MSFYFMKLDSFISYNTKKKYYFIVVIDEDGHSFKQYIKDDEISRFQTEYQKLDDVTDEVHFRYDSKLNAYLPYII